VGFALRDSGTLAAGRPAACPRPPGNGDLGTGLGRALRGTQDRCAIGADQAGEGDQSTTRGSGEEAFQLR
jgi:hypothetical protein